MAADISTNLNYPSFGEKSKQFLSTKYWHTQIFFFSKWSLYRI